MHLLELIALLLGTGIVATPFVLAYVLQRWDISVRGAAIVAVVVVAILVFLFGMVTHKIGFDEANKRR
jgi:hypothetical protein